MIAELGVHRTAATSAAGSATGRAAPSSDSRISTRSRESRDGLRAPRGFEHRNDEAAN
jgi:hypothetical protein